MHQFKGNFWFIWVSVEIMSTNQMVGIMRFFFPHKKWATRTNSLIIVISSANIQSAHQQQKHTRTQNNRTLKIWSSVNFILIPNSIVQFFLLTHNTLKSVNVIFVLYSSLLATRNSEYKWQNLMELCRFSPPATSSEINFFQPNSHTRTKNGNNEH